MRTWATWMVCSVLAAGMVSPADGDELVGRWATEPGGTGGQAHVEILREGDTYIGRIVWLEEPLYPEGDPSGMGGQPKVDLENPDPDLRDRPILGLVIVEGFTPDGPGRWSGGTIYDPENGKTYRCKARLKDGTLLVRGYVGVSLFGRTTEWTRVEPEQ